MFQGAKQMKTIGQNIARFRKEKGITQEQLSEICGVTPQAVSKWEKGLSEPDMETLIKILKEQKSDIIFVGDGAKTFETRFKEAFDNKAFFAPLHLNNQLASSVAKVALDRALNNDFDDMDKLNPLYLKKSQAERMLDGEN